MKLYPLLALAMICLLAAQSRAQEYKVEAVTEAAPTGEFADEILAQVGDAAFKVTKGKRTLVEIWPAKEWSVKAGFTPSSEVLYPFEPGQLIGVVRYKSKGGDFRGQEIKTGLYTLRYGQQPVDGNHVGTAPTRDFFLLLPAAEDKSAGPLGEEPLFKESSDAAGSAHPAILYLRPAAEPGEPALEHDEEAEWWTLSFTNPTSEGKTAVRLIVVGKSKE